MNSKSAKKDSQSLQRLVFRRQFIMGSSRYLPNEYWQSIKLEHGLQLSYHTDLPVVFKSYNGNLICLLGIAIDPFNPTFSETQVLDFIIEKATDLESLIDLCTPLAGRWIFIYQDRSNSYLFTDPTGLRSLFYNLDKNDFWCASQPEIIKDNTKLTFTDNETLLNFLMNTEIGQRESMWIGNKTIYKNCLHLLPNHYLDISSLKQVRFYPLKNIPTKNFKEVVQLSTKILQGIFKSILNRYNFRVALTSGIDSRILLAALKGMTDGIEFYVDRMGILDEDHPDIIIPKKISSKFKLMLNIENSKYDLPGWFVSFLSFNVTNARVLPKTRPIYNKLLTWDNDININGNVSEICRNYYLKSFKGDINNITSEDMARLYGYQSSKFVKEEIDEWQKALGFTNSNSLNILDMLYWEQKLGNWGAQYPAEQDIAIDEISPFNCRLLIETLLSSSSDMRSAPDYKLYLALIQHMWPELLEYPINPKYRPKITRIFKETVRPYIPDHFINLIKRIVE